MRLCRRGDKVVPGDKQHGELQLEQLRWVSKSEHQRSCKKIACEQECICTGVEIKSYRVIYDMVDDLRALMEGKLAPTEERTPVGEAEVRAVFGTGSRIVAGCMVTEGAIKKGCLAVVRPSVPAALLKCCALHYMLRC